MASCEHCGYGVHLMTQPSCCQTQSNHYSWVHKHKQSHPESLMCDRRFLLLICVVDMATDLSNPDSTRGVHTCIFRSRAAEFKVDIVISWAPINVFTLLGYRRSRRSDVGAFFLSSDEIHCTIGVGSRDPCLTGKQSAVGFRTSCRFPRGTN